MPAISPVHLILFFALVLFIMYMAVGYRLVKQKKWEKIFLYQCIIFLIGVIIALYLATHR